MRSFSTLTKGVIFSCECVCVLSEEPPVALWYMREQVVTDRCADGVFRFQMSLQCLTYRGYVLRGRYETVVMYKVEVCTGRCESYWKS